MDTFEQARKRDAALLPFLREIKRKFDTDFAMLIVHCDDGSYHQVCSANEQSTYAEEHSRVADAVHRVLVDTTGYASEVIRDDREPD